MPRLITGARKNLFGEGGGKRKEQQSLNDQAGANHA
jgi:hypothetical protein